MPIRQTVKAVIIKMMEIILSFRLSIVNDLMILQL